MTKQRRLRRSDLFLVRMWTEDTEAGRTLAYGKVHRVVSGEAHQFDTWQGLLDHLSTMLVDFKGVKSPDDAQV
jgi:hypothetical protein